MLKLKNKKQYLISVTLPLVEDLVNIDLQSKSFSILGEVLGGCLYTCAHSCRGHRLTSSVVHLGFVRIVFLFYFVLI